MTISGDGSHPMRSAGCFDPRRFVFLDVANRRDPERQDQREHARGLEFGESRRKPGAQSGERFERCDALRTTNPIERVNKEFKRRSKAMEQVGPEGIKTLLAFTALRLEFGWMQTSIIVSNLQHLVCRKKREARLEEITRGLLH